MSLSHDGNPGLGRQRLYEIQELSQNVERGVSTVLLDGGRTKVHMRSLLAHRRRATVVPHVNLFQPHALRWARIAAHVGTSFATRDSSLFTLLGQQVMQVLATCVRLAAPAPDVLDVAMEVVAYAKTVAIPTAETALTRKVALGMLYTVFSSLPPPIVAGVLEDQQGRYYPLFVDAVRWV